MDMTKKGQAADRSGKRVQVDAKELEGLGHAVADLLNAGANLMIATTKDGGALMVRVYFGALTGTEYVRSGAEVVEELVQALSQLQKGK